MRTGLGLLSCGSSPQGILLLLSVLAASPSAAKEPPVAPESYATGLRALDRGDAAEARELLGEALRERAEDSIGYYPHFYLGVTLQATKNCPAALSSWASFRESSTFPTSGLAAELAERETACSADPVVLDLLEQSAKRLEGAEARQRMLQEFLSNPQVVALLAGSAELRMHSEKAQTAIRQAALAYREFLRTKNPRLIEDASEAGEIYYSASGDLEKLVQSRIADDKPQTKAAAPTDTDRAGRRPREASSLPGVKVPPPTRPTGREIDELERGFDQLFNGNFSAALATALSIPTERLSEPVAAQRWLLSAAARWNLSVIQEGGSAGLERAAQDVHEVRRLAPGFTPAARFFSPRFIRFFDSVTSR